MTEPAYNPPDDFFATPWRMGSLELPNRTVLAPLAGVSDAPFRRICQEHGAGLTYVEMLSAVAVVRGSHQTMGMLHRRDDEPLTGVQVTGSSPDEVAEACVRLEGEGFETIDLNMGCPVRKIVGKGWGSAFLKEPERVEATVRLCRERLSRPLSAKIRIGWSPDTVNVADVSHRIAAAGAEALTIHGRTRECDYSVPVSYAAIRDGFAGLGPDHRPALLGNGDVMDAVTAHEMVRHTGCDAVMVSRGALGNPWIFRQIVEQSDYQPDRDEWLEVVLRHLDYIEHSFGDGHLPSVRFRKHLLWYTAGFPGSRKMRAALSTLEGLSAIRSVVEDYAAGIPDGYRRYQENDRDFLRMRAQKNDPKYDMDRTHDRGVGGDEGG